MADIVTTNAKLSIKLTMYRAEDDSEKTRTFSIDNPVIDEEGTQFRAKLQALQNFLLGDGKNLIQPTGWRDDDANELEYTTTAVEFTTSDGTNTEWDTRLTHNLTVTPTTLSYADLATSIDDSTDVTINGAALDFDKLQVSFAQDEGTDGALAFGWHGFSDSLGAFFAIKEEQAGIGTTATGLVTLTIPAEGVYQEATATIRVGE